MLKLDVVNGNESLKMRAEIWSGKLQKRILATLTTSQRKNCKFEKDT